jgi:hypothetical protein
MENELLKKQLKLVGDLGYSKNTSDRNQKEIYLMQNGERLERLEDESKEAMDNFTSKLKEETKKYGKPKQTKRKQVRKRGSKTGGGIWNNC